MPPLPRAELLGRNSAPIAQPSPAGAYDIVFLDRDGTLNVHRPGYVDDPADLTMLPGAAAAVRRLNESGCAVVLVTNQRGLATGALREQQLVSVHEKLLSDLQADGAHLDAIHVCPHDTGTCDCRKPGTGLFTQALSRAPWALARRCAVIGDQPSDIAPALKLGMGAYQVGQGALFGVNAAVAQLFKCGTSH